MALSKIAALQPRAWSLLSRAVRTGRVAGAYLFAGREGLGHWPLAVSFAALLNCRSRQEQGDTLLPCGECPSCHAIDHLNSRLLQIVAPIPSHKNLDEAIELTNQVLAAKRKEPLAILSSAAQVTIPISLAREVKQRLTRKEEAGHIRVVLFYQMEKMLAQSADALLKMIEEPPADTVIILSAETPDALLSTIRSRSQMVRLERVSEQAIIDYLHTHNGTAEAKAKLAARISDCNPGRALEIAAEEDGGELSRRSTAFVLFKSLFLDAPPQTVSHIYDMLGERDRGEAEETLRLWATLIRDCAAYAGTGDESAIINCDFAPDLMKFSARFVDASVAAAMQTAVKNALADIRLNAHIHTTMAALALRLGAVLQTRR